MNALRLPPLSPFVDDVAVAGSFACDSCHAPLTVGDLLGGDLCPHCGDSVLLDFLAVDEGVGVGVVAPSYNNSATPANLADFGPVIAGLG